MGEKVIRTATAREDLRQIVEYIARDRPASAEACGLELIAFADMAGDFPRAGRKVPEANDENIREPLKSPYRIIYELFPHEPRPVIMRVWHGARGVPELQQSFRA